MVRCLFCAFCAFLWPSSVLIADSLDNAFANPPTMAKPRTWWHWIGGNVSREGITADLESMQVPCFS